MRSRLGVNEQGIFRAQQRKQTYWLENGNNSMLKEFWVSEPSHHLHLT